MLRPILHFALEGLQNVHAPLMRVWQNLLAMIGVIAAAFALLPLPARARLTCIAIAGTVIALTLALRLRQHGRARAHVRSADTWGRIERIRAERAKRGRR